MLLTAIYFIGIVICLPSKLNDALEFIILHNNDLHGRFDQINANAGDCSPNEIAENKCYGGFARIAYK